MEEKIVYVCQMVDDSCIGGIFSTNEKAEDFVVKETQEYGYSMYRIFPYTIDDEV